MTSNKEQEWPCTAGWKTPGPEAGESVAWRASLIKNYSIIWSWFKLGWPLQSKVETVTSRKPEGEVAGSLSNAPSHYRLLLLTPLCNLPLSVAGPTGWFTSNWDVTSVIRTTPYLFLSSLALPETSCHINCLSHTSTTLNFSHVILILLTISNTNSAKLIRLLPFYIDNYKWNLIKSNR